MARATLEEMARIERAVVGELRKRLRAGPNLLQVVVGPRQVGKTTALEHVMASWRGGAHYASADLPAPPDAAWIGAQWAVAREQAARRRTSTLLVLDEVQKVPRWSEVVKAEFDEDRRRRRPIRVVLLGSAALLVARGASESLAGRFERHFVPHWSLEECRRAFRWDLDRWLFFGGYPGAAPLVRSPARWVDYVRSSLIEPVVARDVLQLAQVAKPALLRRLLGATCAAPAEVVSLTKLLGQLQDAGNVVTLAHYLELLGSAFVVSGLQRWSPERARLRASPPKLVFWSNTFVTASAGESFREARSRPERWGRLVENAVGAYLLAGAEREGFEVWYWRDGADEVDYVVGRGDRVWAVEVKSGRPRSARGLASFQRRYPKARTLLVGSGGIPLADFFAAAPGDWLSGR